MHPWTNNNKSVHKIIFKYEWLLSDLFSQNLRTYNSNWTFLSQLHEIGENKQNNLIMLEISHLTITNWLTFNLWRVCKKLPHNQNVVTRHAKRAHNMLQYDIWRLNVLMRWHTETSDFAHLQHIAIYVKVLTIINTRDISDYERLNNHTSLPRIFIICGRDMSILMTSARPQFQNKPLIGNFASFKCMF